MTDQFEADHAPGNRTLTASRWPALVLPPEHRPRWLCSPYSLGLHMLGEEPLPEGDFKTLRRGKLLEPVGKALLAEDHAIYLVEEQVRRELPALPAICYLDGLAHAPIYDRWAVEMKSMPERVYRDQWDGAPPLYPRVQAQAQMAIDQELVGVLIVPIVVSFAGNPDIPQVYEEPRDDAIGGMLVSTGQAFLRMLERRELPAPDETIASYDAVMRTLKVDPGETVVLADDEAVRAFQQWQMCKSWAKVGDGEDACKRYFAARAGNAAVIEIPGAGRIERKQIEKKGYEVSAHRETRWALKEEK